MNLAAMMSTILEHSCSNPREEGWSQYQISLCCQEFLVVARKGSVGYEIKGWNYESDLWEWVGDKQRMRTDPEPLRTF